MTFAMSVKHLCSIHVIKWLLMIWIITVCICIPLMAIILDFIYFPKYKPIVMCLVTGAQAALTAIFIGLVMWFKRADVIRPMWYLWPLYIHVSAILGACLLFANYIYVRTILKVEQVPTLYDLDKLLINLITRRVWGTPLIHLFLCLCLSAHLPLALVGQFILLRNAYTKSRESTEDGTEPHAFLLPVEGSDSENSTLTDRIIANLTTSHEISDVELDQLVDEETQESI